MNLPQKTNGEPILYIVEDKPKIMLTKQTGISIGLLILLIGAVSWFIQSSTIRDSRIQRLEEAMVRMEKNHVTTEYVEGRFKLIDQKLEFIIGKME